MAQNKPKNTIIKDTVSLVMITLIAGLLLGFVYELTKGPIQDAKNAEKREAYASVYKDAKDFTDANNQYTEVGDTSSDMLATQAGITNVTITEVLEAISADGSVLGHVMTVTSHEGYGGDVPISIGISKDGTIQGVEVLDNDETQGFGSKAKDPAFKDQFSGLQADNVEAGKNFDGISGATRTTNAVTKAINAALYFAKNGVSN